MTKAFICGCVRNCEEHIDAVFSTIQQIETLFSDTHVIVAYDQSHDKTLLKLTQYKRLRGEKMDVLINRNPLSIRRTENIANARNAILERIRGLFKYDDEWPIFIMMDFDDVCDGPPNLDVLRRVLQRESEWDSISFNRPGYYDIWALSLSPFLYSAWGWDGPREVVRIMREHLLKILGQRKPEDWLACRSAFNGFALYKTSLFLTCRYDWRRPIEHISVSDFELNRSALGFRATRSPIRTQTDEPDCEHRSFHMSAISRFGAKIWISPECLFMHPILGHA
jgi:hypothetical protein